MFNVVKTSLSFFAVTAGQNGNNLKEEYDYFLVAASSSVVMTGRWSDFKAGPAILSTTRMDGETSVCNSPALLGWPDVRSDWVRPGLMLYGANPLPDNTALTERLRPVMTMQSKVIAERWIEAGEPVGYGARFVAKARTRVGVVALGYADGYPQFAPNGTPVLIDGQPGVLIGRVSMDMLTVDLTAHAQAGIGSVVELWGSAPTLSELAPRCGVSAYQLPCAVKRVAKVYV